MKTKVKSMCTNKKVCLAAGLLAGVAILAWGYCAIKRPTVGVIDFTAAQGKAKVYQSVINEQKKYEEQIRVRIAADSIELEKEAKDLEGRKDKLSSEEYQKKAQALQRRFIIIQDKYRPMVERIAIAGQVALKSAEKEINEAIKQTTKQAGVKVLLPRNIAIDAVESVDFTDTFVKKFG